MKAKYSFFLILFYYGLSAQAVKNVDYDYSEASEQIEITYDLIKQGAENYFDILVEISLEGTSVEVKAISGDIGKYIKAGIGKTITWDVFKDVASLEGDLAVDVLATPSGGGLAEEKASESQTQLQVKSGGIPAWAGLGSLFAVGGGLLAKGAIDASGAKSDWDGESSQSASNVLYEDLNSQYKSGQYLMIGGGAALAAGIYLLIKRSSSGKSLSISHLELELIPDSNINLRLNESLYQGFGFGLAHGF